MKGPAARWKHDVRRIWECPACQRRQRSGGEVVFLACDCLAKSDPPRTTWMRLVEVDAIQQAPASEVGPQEPVPSTDPPQ